MQLSFCSQNNSVPANKVMQWNIRILYDQFLKERKFQRRRLLTENRTDETSAPAILKGPRKTQFVLTQTWNCMAMGTNGLMPKSSISKCIQHNFWRKKYKDVSVQLFLCSWWHWAYAIKKSNGARLIVTELKTTIIRADLTAKQRRGMSFLDRLDQWLGPWASGNTFSMWSSVYRLVV